MERSWQTTLIGCLPSNALHDLAVTLADQRTEIIGAIDMLIAGV